MSDREVAEDWSEDATSAFDVANGEFVVVSPDAADLKLYRPLCGVLARVRKAFGIEATFITEWCRGGPVMRAVSDDASCEADLLQSTYGRRLLESFEPQVRKGFESFPVITNDGIQHGVLCCTFALKSDEAADRARQGAMRSVARLIADWYEGEQGTFSGFSPTRVAPLELLPA